jgi:hypothetical protein
LQLEEKYGVKIVGIKDIQNGIVLVEKKELDGYGDNKD